jgi:hypothetical protein
LEVDQVRRGWSGTTRAWSRAGWDGVMEMMTRAAGKGRARFRAFRERCVPSRLWYGACRTQAESPPPLFLGKTTRMVLEKLRKADDDLLAEAAKDPSEVRRAAALTVGLVGPSP